MENRFIKVNEMRCPQNHHCPSIAICPAKAISQHNFNLPQIDDSKCIKCGKCINYCPKNAFYFG